MKSAFGVLLFCTSLSPAQSAEEQIRTVLSDQMDAWNRGDLEGYMKGYWDSDQTTFVSGGSVTEGYAEVLSRYKKRYDSREKMGILSFEELTVRMLSEGISMVTGLWRLRRNDDSPWGRFTLILEKKSEGWRITYDHTSATLP
ncbi:MAG: DUF4440 domain-containing protein [Ignavibacteriales bacterium]|nr:DUF4440 domain-containing protein [Ignavibacteriales bacterium]